MQYVGVGFLAVQVAQQCSPRLFFSFTSRLCSNLSSSANQVAGCGRGKFRKLHTDLCQKRSLCAENVSWREDVQGFLVAGDDFQTQSLNTFLKENTHPESTASNDAEFSGRKASVPKIIAKTITQAKRPMGKWQSEPLSLAKRDFLITLIRERALKQPKVAS